MRRIIHIFRDDVWAGTGELDDDGTIVNCSAILGPDQEASDKTYEAIEDAIAGGYDPDETKIDRPDGEYTWKIE